MDAPKYKWQTAHPVASPRSRRPPSFRYRLSRLYDMLNQRHTAAAIVAALCAASSPIVLADVNAGFNVRSAADVAVSHASHSWEWGTTAQALLELDNNDLSVFGDEPFPNGQIPHADPNIRALAYVKPHIRRDGQTLTEDKAVGDPASMGVSALLLGTSDSVYNAAADRQADYILHKAPKFSNGAISQRADVKELWADNMAMSFPFLAYYAVYKNDRNAMKEVVRQCGLYRDILKIDKFLNWRHIIGPQSQDEGLWSTGNGWAGYGMVRVLYTLQKWSGSRTLLDEQGKLKTWIKEILDGAMLSGREDLGLLRNYLNDAGWFGEVSGTALLSAVAYRMAVNDPAMFPQKYIDWADQNRRALGHQQGGDGVVVPAVNPLAWKDRNKYYGGSPEGQAFMVNLYTAYRDCVNKGICHN
ncbi:Six-hairpin glycosidase [Akanthomyces lecanii RCEF 1005]|uniref:Six-hairpin glycosidase n=1 Tax=Akanthomyces lecanii RCEF 1005 TaxID=1081108 RepID=A0A168EV37_CORDF|nr:Six-hairpin glycosidase [Akanthomyces lecanii RCEF 1005]